MPENSVNRREAVQVWNFHALWTDWSKRGVHENFLALSALLDGRKTPLFLFIFAKYGAELREFYIHGEYRLQSDYYLGSYIGATTMNGSALKLPK